MAGRKDDLGKPTWALLPFDAVEEVVRVLDYGAQHYGAHNWRRGIAYSRLLSAAFRHLAAFARGRRTDPATGRHHLAHAVCELLFLLEFELNYSHELDDLAPPGKIDPGLE